MKTTKDLNNPCLVKNGFYCTLTKGHEGIHVAHGDGETIVAAYDDEGHFVCPHCRRVFNTANAVADHLSRVGTSFDDCNQHVSPSAKENGEKVARVLESGALVVGAHIESESGCVFRLEERVLGSGGKAFWNARLVSKPPHHGAMVGRIYTKDETFVLKNSRIVAEPNFTLPKTTFETKRDVDLADECGKLRHEKKQLQALLQTTSEALQDVMAFLGPTRVREFERWREKTRK